jgi:hypothetical protein
MLTRRTIDRWTCDACHAETERWTEDGPPREWWQITVLRMGDGHCGKRDFCSGCADKVNKLMIEMTS